jgi:hypothetical protein
MFRNRRKSAVISGGKEYTPRNSSVSGIVYFWLLGGRHCTALNSEILPS